MLLIEWHHDEIDTGDSAGVELSDTEFIMLNYLDRTGQRKDNTTVSSLEMFLILNLAYTFIENKNIRM